MSNSKTLFLTLATVAALNGSLTACGSIGAVSYKSTLGGHEIHAFHPSSTPLFCDQGAKLGISGQTIGNYGVKIIGVQTGSLADRLQLERGDIILSVNGCRVRSVSELRGALKDAIRKGGKVVIKVDNIRARQGHCDQRIVVVRGHLSECSADFPSTL